MMMDSGARGNISNFVQLTGMRGLMSKAIHVYAALKRQNILVRSTEEIPIKSSFKSGLTTFEFYQSTNGARKGLSDTATKTAESGYLTRRLVDAVQDIIVREDDCGTDKGFDVEDIKDIKLASVIEPLFDRIVGRYSNEDVKVGTKKLVLKNGLITEEIAKEIVNAGIEKVNIRSVLACKTTHGVCKQCYGMDLTNGKEVNIGEAVGIVSAQSIGEPGTQLTMRTFHTGGVAGVADITQGFSRLLELVDANRNPKSPAKIVRVDGTIKSIKKIEKGERIKQQVIEIIVKNKNEEHIHYCSPLDSIRVKVGQEVTTGQKITDGSIRLQELLEFAGVEALQNYMIKEIQRLYRIQGIDIADKYMEVIIRQMLSKLKVVQEGDTSLYAGQVVSVDRLKQENLKCLKDGKEIAYARPMVLGVKPLPLHSDSFLASASYQRTAEALVNAAINMKEDNLRGIKENLIVGKKIPVGTGHSNPQGKYDIFADIVEKEKKYEEKNKKYGTNHDKDITIEIKPDSLNEADEEKIAINKK
jgi:DNA-directed RNA polymerase subunit beta'